MAAILIVDDDPHIQDGLKDILEDAGYDVSTAGNAADASALLMAQMPDLVIIDYNLPDIKGPTWAAQLPVQPRPPAVILMTGMAVGDLPSDPLPEIVVETLVKPVSPDLLLITLKRVLTARPS